MFSDTQLWNYVDGQASDDIERAAREDGSLRARIDQMRAIKSEIVGGAPAPSPGVADRVVALAGTTPVFDINEARRILKRALVAAAVLAAIGLAYLAVEVGPELLAPSRLQANPLLSGK